MALWWKRKKAKPAIGVERLVQLPALDYAETVLGLIKHLDPASRAHVAVAYQNLVPLVGALRSFAKENNEAFSLEEFMIEIDEKLPNIRDEINNRRYSWILFAAFVLRMAIIANDNPETIPAGATIWTMLAAEYPRLKFLLPNNIVWKEDEKVWFDLSKSDNSLVNLGLRIHAPKVFSSHDIAQRFIRERGLLVWD